MLLSTRARLVEGELQDGRGAQSHPVGTAFTAVSSLGHEWPVGDALPFAGNLQTTL